MHTQRPEFLVVVLTLCGRREDRGRKSRAVHSTRGQALWESSTAGATFTRFLKPVVRAATWSPFAISFPSLTFKSYFNSISGKKADEKL